MRTITTLTLTFLFILQTSYIQADSEIQLDEDEQACIVDTEVSEDLVIEAKETHTIYLDDAKYKEFLSCCWKRYHFQKEDGEIDWEKVGEVLEQAYSPAVVEKLIKKCDEIEGETDGDTVAQVLHCLDSHAPSFHHINGFYGGGHY